MHRKQALIFTVLLFEFSLFCLVGFFGFWLWQRYQQQKRIELTTKIDSTKVTRIESSELRYFYMPKSNRVEEHDSSDTSWLKSKVTYHFNSEGMNDLYDYPLEKEPDSFRIITLGDSFTFGQFVSTAENWTELVEVALNTNTQICKAKKIEVLNLGVYGYGVEYIAKRYQLIGEKYRPDLIIWYESGSGFRRMNEREYALRAACEERMVNQDQSIATMAAKIQCSIEVSDQVMSRQLTFADRKLIGDKYRTFFEKYADTPIMLFSSLNAWTEDTQFMKNQYIKGFDQVRHEMLVGFADEDKFPDHHPNVGGHQKIANAVTTYLQQNQDFICSKYVAATAAAILTTTDQSVEIMQ